MMAERITHGPLWPTIARVWAEFERAHQSKLGPQAWYWWRQRFAKRRGGR